MLFLHRISLEFLFAWFPFVRLHFSFMHVFSAAKAWSLLFAPCCWFIILYSYSRVEIQEDTLYTFFSLISDDLHGRAREKKWGERALKKLDSPPFCRCVRPRAFCDFFSLSTALSTQIKEMDDRSPWYAFNQQRVLRKGGRTEKKSISFSTVPTTGEFVFINTRFFCVASLGRRFVRVRLPSFGVFCYAGVHNGGKKIWADEFWEKNQTRAHFCSPHFVRRGVEDLRRYASECEITRTTGTNTSHEKVFSLFLFWTTTMPW